MISRAKDITSKVNWNEISEGMELYAKKTAIYTLYQCFPIEFSVMIAMFYICTHGCLELKIWLVQLRHCSCNFIVLRLLLNNVSNLNSHMWLVYTGQCRQW